MARRAATVAVSRPHLDHLDDLDDLDDLDHLRS
jgi:hypothetical protein